MNVNIFEAAAARDTEWIEKNISKLEASADWTLGMIVDQLLPLAVMESNLQYGSFHRVKMALFLKRMAESSLLTRETQLELARMLCLDLARQEWVRISASEDGTDRLSNPVQNMLDAMEERNVHNSFYYACCALEHDRLPLCTHLLQEGCSFIQQTLGHSFSCFYPAVSDVLMHENPQTPAALLSYIMYLCRYSGHRKAVQDSGRSGGTAFGLDDLLRMCASGSGIESLHHMITFCMMREWEQSALRPETGVPWGILETWISGKNLDEARAERTGTGVADLDTVESFELFAELFVFDRPELCSALVLKQLARDFRKTIDWIFRLTAMKYNRSQNPHVITGMYCALMLYRGLAGDDPEGAAMAVDQAVYYTASQLK